MSDKRKGNGFSDLVCAIRKTHEQCSAHAGQAINVSLTLRNWMIGRHISEFELKGADRAVYGERLLRALSVELRKSGVSGCGARQLYGYLAFYRTYPGIARSVTASFKKLLPTETHNDMADSKVRSVTALLALPAQKVPGSRTFPAHAGEWIETPESVVYNGHSPRQLRSRVLQMDAPSSLSMHSTYSYTQRLSQP